MATAPGSTLEGPPLYVGPDPPPPYPDERETRQPLRTKDNARPQQCPNQCESKTLTQSELEKHLLVCPLQIVECEFSQYGCNVKVPRRELDKHMRESTDKHLMNATLLNLRLTRDLHQKLDEKGQQIAALQQQVTQLTQRLNNSTNGFSCHDFVLNNFNEHQARGSRGEWQSPEFADQFGGYRFNLQIDTNGYHEARGTHLTAWLNLYANKYGAELTNPIRCLVHLKMLNQSENHNHHVVVGNVEYSLTAISRAPITRKLIGKSYKFFPLSELNADKTIRFLKDDCLHFRLYLKTDHMYPPQ